MITEQWQIGFVTVALAVNAMLAYRAYRLHREEHPAAMTFHSHGDSQVGRLTR